jgi:hypothetical protein
MKPTLEEIVAAFRAKQYEEYDTAKKAVEAEQKRRQDYVDEAKSLLEPIHVDAKKILAPLVLAGHASIQGIDVHGNSVSFKFATQPPQSGWRHQTVGLFRRTGEDWTYFIDGEWRSACFDIKNPTELLLKLCEGAGRRMAERGL